MNRSRLLSVLAFILSVVATVPCAVVGAEPSPAALVAEGDAAVLRFDLAGAATAYQAALKTDPNHYEAHWKLARTLADQATLSTDPEEEKKLVHQAEPVAREAVRLNPNDSKGHAYLAIAVGKLALYLGGKEKVELSKEVKTEAEKAASLNPKEDLAFHILGVWNREMAELNWLLKAFAELFYGKFPPASLKLAESSLRTATELAPNVVAHHVELGITLADARRWREADKELEHALSMPKVWATDDYYKGLAKKKVEEVKRHL